MQHWETIHEETREGFDIVFSIAPEDTHPRDSFDMDSEELAQLCEDIDRGRYCWFVARVQAFRAGVELATDYLGGCLYEDPRELMNPGDYFDDMVKTVIDEARQELPRLIAALEI